MMAPAEQRTEATGTTSEPPRVPMQRWAVFAFWHDRRPNRHLPGGIEDHHEEMCLGIHDDYESAKKQEEKIPLYRNLRGLRLFTGGAIYGVPNRPLEISDLQFERLSEDPGG